MYALFWLFFGGNKEIFSKSCIYARACMCMNHIHILTFRNMHVGTHVCGCMPVSACVSVRTFKEVATE